MTNVSKMISEPMVRSTQTVQLSCVKISTIFKWGELSLEPRHLGVPSGASKAISKPMVRFGAKCAPILHRHLHSLQTERSEIPHDPRQQGVPSGASKMISEPIVCSTQTVHLSCIKISTISKRIKLSLEPRHLGYHQVHPK